MDNEQLEIIYLPYQNKVVILSADLPYEPEEISEKHELVSKEGLYELRIEYQSNIYRIFFCFDEGRIVILFNGFQKKTEKTPKKEIEKAKILRKEYYGSKNK